MKGTVTISLADYKDLEEKANKGIGIAIEEIDKEIQDLEDNANSYPPPRDYITPRDVVVLRAIKKRILNRGNEFNRKNRR